MELSNFSSIFEIATGFNLGMAKSKDFREFIGTEKRFKTAVANNLKEVQSLRSLIQEKKLTVFQDIGEGIEKLENQAKTLDAEYKIKFENSQLNNKLYILHIFFAFFSFAILVLCGIIIDLKHDSSLLLLETCAFFFIIFWFLFNTNWKVQEFIKVPGVDYFNQANYSATNILVFFTLLFFISILLFTEASVKKEQKRAIGLINFLVKKYNIKLN